MDCSMCNGCRTRISTMFAILVISLVLSPVKVSSVKLSEQKCQPRPVVVQETQGYRPFHVELFRCAGTCDEKIPPKQKPCSVSHSQVILLEVRDPLSGKPATIKVDNHTSCHCQCDLKCKWDQGETPDEENCRCNIEPTAEETRGEKTTADVLPYKIGLASMGFLTLIVLVFELIMCTKRKEVLERVKKGCSQKGEHMDGKAQNKEVTTV